jgi:hypothetical protein
MFDHARIIQHVEISTANFAAKPPRDLGDRWPGGLLAGDLAASERQCDWHDWRLGHDDPFRICRLAAATARIITITLIAQAKNADGRRADRQPLDTNDNSDTRRWPRARDGELVDIQRSKVAKENTCSLLRGSDGEPSPCTFWRSVGRTAHQLKRIMLKFSFVLIANSIPHHAPRATSIAASRRPNACISASTLNHDAR